MSTEKITRRGTVLEAPQPPAVPQQGFAPRQREGLGVLRAIIDRISSGSDMDSVLADVIALCSNLTACRGALIYLWDERNEELVAHAATPEFRFAIGVVRLRIGQGLTGWAAMTRQPGVISDHPALDPRFVSLKELDDDAFQSCLSVPLIARGNRLLGVITLHSEAPGSFDEETVELMRTISSLVADAVRLVQLERQVGERDESLHHLTAAVAVHEAGMSTAQRLYHLARTARDLMNADLGAIIACDGEHRSLRVATWCSDEPVTMQHHPIDLGAEWSRFLHSPTAAYRVTDASPFRALIASGLAFSTCLIAPVIMAGDPIGMVCCLDRRGRGLSAAECRDLTALARIAAPVIGELVTQHGHRAARSARGLLELLRAGDTEGALVRQLVRECGMNTADPCVVLECTSGAMTEPTSFFGELEEALLRVFPAALVDVSPNVLTALLPHHDAAADAALAQVVQKFIKPGSEPRVGVGCSEPARMLPEYPDRLHQATVAATVSLVASRCGALVRYENLGAERYLWSVAMEADDVGPGEPVERLAAYDRQRGTDLLRTLECYLSLGANVNRTAAELFLHRNTLRQRLDRIAQLADVNLNDPTKWFDLMLAIRLHKLREGIQ